MINYRGSSLSQTSSYEGSNRGPTDPDTKTPNILRISSSRLDIEIIIIFMGDSYFSTYMFATFAKNHTFLRLHTAMYWK